MQARPPMQTATSSNPYSQPGASVPAMGAGAMQGVSYVQRLKTQGGVAPSAPCTMANKMERRQVAYQADYVFYGR